MHGGPLYRAAEFFAGIGLVGMALEQTSAIEVAWANDIEPTKFSLYRENFDEARFRLGDVRAVSGSDLPPVDLATASFPCTDLSLAGNRAGLAGTESSMFWEFARILGETGPTRPPVVLLENVPGFATSHGGADLVAAISELNRLGYSCDVFTVDARVFVPQSRLRLFIVGAQDPPSQQDWNPSEIRPAWLCRFLQSHRGHLRLHAARAALPKPMGTTLGDVVERLPPDSPRWWDDQRTTAFVESLTPLQAERLTALASRRKAVHRTAYRRTRGGVAVWEIRPDEIAGCLRTARGGSSKQALVEAGRGEVRVRWMTPREYAALMGAPGYRITSVTEAKALFGFGDAVCVPVIKWVTEAFLLPALAGNNAAFADAG